jgi:uncharacterized protein (DUF1810 family)
MSGSFDLSRFVEAQAGVYTQVIDELSTGRKRSHWMWFIFPQIVGLGYSANGATLCDRLARRGRRIS